MPVSLSARLLPIGALLVGVALAGCSSSSSTGPTAVSLAGNYNLTALSIGGSPLPVDVSDGATLVLTATTYDAVGFGFDSVVTDSGAYLATSSGAFEEESGKGRGGVTGTYTLSSNTDTLSETVNSNNVLIVSTWVK
jgi:hypothetical protein